MKTNHPSPFTLRHLPFVLLATVCLAALPARAQTYWGYALSFNGTNSYVSFGAVPPLSNSWTAEFWVNRQDSPNTAATLLDDGITSLRLEQYNETKLVGFTKYGAADYTFNYTAPTNTWVHLAFLSDTTNTYLYVNGVAQDTNANTIALPLSLFGAITNGSAVGGALEGTIDEIRVWDVVRSAAEIQADLAQPLTNPPAALVAYWKFDEGSGTTTYDATTNHHDGTLVNGPTWVVSTVPIPFIYTTNNGTITITGYTGPGGAVTIPSAINGPPVTSIGDDAFYYCTGLTSVAIPDSVTSIVSDAFVDCFSLMSITVDTNNPAYSSVDGVLFDKSQTTLIECPGGRAGNYTVPDGVTSIGENAFWGCPSLTSITIPISVTSIGDLAFSGCYSLTSLTIPDSVTSIGYCEFLNCYNLTSVTIPNGVTSIGEFAFASCTSLANVTIPDSVSSIGEEAFANCFILTGVYFRGNAPSLGSGVFASDDNATVYYLPGTTGWATFDANSGLGPAVLWNAQVPAGNASFGVKTNQFGFIITGTSNIPVVVEACTNLACPAWTPLQTCTVTNGAIYFCDPQWTNYPARFYRVCWP